jgi:hypothetical protein
MKVRESIERHLEVRSSGQGWSDAQVVMSLILLNLAGGKCVDDLRVMEGDEGGPARGPLPSGKFGQNAAWWWIMVLAFNLNAVMKGLVLGRSWVSKRMKAIRYHLIRLPGRVLERSRRLIIRLGRGHPCYGLLVDARTRINELALEPSG